MPRIRSIKPSFFASEDVSALPYRARLTWIGLWTHCDDQGRCKDNARLIKAALWALDDVSLRDVEEDLTVLADYGRITRYEAGGKPFLQVTNWHHQRIQKPTPGVIPAMSATPTEPLPDSPEIGGVRKGGEGMGGDARGSVPETRCPKHKGQADSPPCGACADARREYEAWKLRRDLAPTPIVGTDSREECPDHQGQLSWNCSSCAADRKAAS